MRILFLGLNYAPEEIGIGPYSTSWAEALARSGHDVTVIAGQPYYPAWQVMDGYRRWGWKRTRENGVSVVRCPHYVPGTPSGAKRLIHHASFALSSLVPMMRRAITGRFDLVITVAPSLIAAAVARLAAKVGGARSWLHVQDFELEAAFATGLLKDGGSFARFANGFERSMLKSFGRVSSISPQMVARLIEKGVSPERTTELRNWAEIDSITPLQAHSRYREKWGITTPHVALYSGNIANKQGIEIIVDAARQLRHRDDLTFVVCGNGPNRARLERIGGDLPNIRFHDLQPRECLSELLGLATIHLLPQLADAADLVLPSKLANMMASGRPIVATAAPTTGIAQEIEGCGIAVPPGDGNAMASAIVALLDDPEERNLSGMRARALADARWSKDRMIASFVEQVEA